MLTPTYRRDFQYFCDLHASVLRHTADKVVHHVIVPSKDVSLFKALESPRLKIHRTQDFLPRGFLPASAAVDCLNWVPGFSKVPLVRSLARGELFLSMQRPWLPVRGWILQQIVKMAAVTLLDADVVLIADSDVALVRPISGSEFVRNGAIRFYRKPFGVKSDMPQHVLWHNRARKLLGLHEAPTGALPDYIASFLAWDPKIVERIQKRISTVSDTHWASTLAKEVALSEWTVYGTYIDHLGDEKDRSFTASESLCHSYWKSSPMDRQDAEEFIEATQGDECAILIQSTSGTPLEIRRDVIAAIEERFRRQASSRRPAQWCG
jgi:hypothetical protein